jgi:hypothetical protein
LTLDQRGINAGRFQWRCARAGFDEPVAAPPPEEVTMRKTIGLACLLVLVLSTVVFADVRSFRVTLTGYQEDPLPLSTTGRGEFRARIDRDRTEIEYSLSYESLEGNITQAHIHFGGRGQSGGIMVFLCTNQGNGPAGTQVCPAAPATITGTIRAADVIGPQTAYVNVHTSAYPAGEIRAQISR